MAEDRARAIAAAMKKHQNPRWVARRRDRPFSRYAGEVGTRELHVFGCRPDRADLVEALAPLRPPDRPRLRAEQRPHRNDFVLSYVSRRYYCHCNINLPETLPGNVIAENAE